MKRWLFLIAAVLLLSGCAAEPEDTTPTALYPAEANLLPTSEPTGYYDPDSTLEAATNGAVRVYPLNRSDSYGLVSMEDDLLLLSGTEVTTLTKLTGSNLYVSAAANLDCYIPADSPAFHAGSKGVTYYDALHRELVYLDIHLKEVSRMSLPETITGSPALSSDRKILYYCTADAVRAIDLETNLDKLLRQTAYVSQSILALHCDNTILECSAEDSYGNRYTLFISADTGETLYETTNNIFLRTLGQNYFSIHQEGAYRELIAGSNETGPNLLVSAEYNADAYPLMEARAVVLTSSAGENTRLNYYDLEAGLRTYELQLPGTEEPRCMLGSAADDCVWALRYDTGYQSDILCRWELRTTPTDDKTIYLSTHYTAEDPDQEGIAALKEEAAAIAAKYGVEILLWTDAVSQIPEAYSAIAEYQVPLLNHYLQILDEALAIFPNSFLQEAAAGTGSGKIRIGLVRSITDAEKPDTCAGIQFWDKNENVYIITAIGTDMVSTLYNELFHVIDSRVMSTCSAFDDWEDLNPKKFQYSYSYQISPELDSSLFQGEDRAFIDAASTTFPREDRATIMEYAMQEGNESCFASKIMQKKLRQLCLGIREALDLEDSTETFLWEQYLEKSLAKS